MRHPAFLAAILAATIPLSACGYSVFDAAEDMQGNDNGLAAGQAITKQTATTASFSKVNTVGPDDVVFVTGDSFSIKAEGDAEAIKLLRYTIKDGTVIIGRSKKAWWSSDGDSATVTITAPLLTEAALAGSGNFKSDTMTGDALMLAIAGSGDATISKVSGKKLTAKIAGSGDVIVSGTSDDADFAVLGSGNIDATKLVAATAKISIAGSGDIGVNATKTVDANIAGSGGVTVTGGAKCTKSVVGSGTVTCG
jgi:Putative auto-transporter adhesin, head GIN domain